MSFSVPIEYRDSQIIDAQAAVAIAESYASSTGCLLTDARPTEGYAPLFWAFCLRGAAADEDRVGAVVMIDRCDGHIWTLSEYEEYMYDYNNAF